MSFNAESLKTRIQDFLHREEGDFAPYVQQIKDAVHGAIDMVWHQVEAFERAPHERPAGPVVDADTGDPVDVPPPAMQGAAVPAEGAVTGAVGADASSNDGDADHGDRDRVSERVTSEHAEHGDKDPSVTGRRGTAARGKPTN